MNKHGSSLNEPSAPALPDERKPYPHPRTASRVFGPSAVIISPAENVVRLLNPVGSRIWELADGTRTPAQIATCLSDEYAIDMTQARQSVERFLAELTAKQLLSWQGTEAPDGPPARQSMDTSVTFQTIRHLSDG